MSTDVKPTSFSHDFHTHYLTDRVIAEAQSAGIIHPDGMPGFPKWTIERHLALMDRTGIERAMLSLSAPGVHFGDDAAARDLARHVNDVGRGFALELPERFGHFAILPLPDVAGAIVEARRCLDEPGSEGVNVLTNYGGRYLGHPDFTPLLEELDRRRALVFVHPISPHGAETLDLGRPHPMLEFIFETTRTVSDLALTNAFDRFPGIRWIFSHGGGALPMLAERIELFRTTILADQSNRRTVQEQLRDVWFDSAGTPFPHQMPATIAAFGDTHVVYGSDSCWTADEGVVHQVSTIDQAAQPPDGTWRQLFSRNAAKLLAV